jgi:hypothetical protein
LTPKEGLGSTVVAPSLRATISEPRKTRENRPLGEAGLALLWRSEEELDSFALDHLADMGADVET